jgi:hypothetical protein|tara:strand:+ start:1916 stop:2326 length:411 start_codon:yes stop_codon:yes gene_type:complete
MKFIGIDGKERNLKKATNYLINWDKGSRSKFQASVKEFLRPYWESHVVFEEFRIVGTRLSLDFYNATRNIAVEVQGDQHAKYVKFFHGKNKMNYVDQLKRDANKFDFCEKNGIILVEIYSKDTIDRGLFLSFGVTL